MSKNYTNYNKPNSANKQKEEQKVTPVTPDVNENEQTTDPAAPEVNENEQTTDPATPDVNNGQPTDPAAPDINNGQSTDPATPEDDEQTSDPEPDGIVPIIGVVSNCKMLNVRADTNKKAEIITIIPAGTEVVVCLLDKNDEWLEVHSIEGEPGVVGFHGFCMKEFITIK